MPPFKTHEITKREKKKNLFRSLRDALHKGFFNIENQIYSGSVHFNDTAVFNVILCHCKKKLFQISTSNFNGFSLTFISTDVTQQCQNRFLD